MSRRKLLIVVCAVFALTALTSATASAAEGWDVNGTLLTGTAALLPTALVLNAGEIQVLGLELSIICKAHEILINEGVLKAPDGILAKSITFHLCETVGPGSERCVLASDLITMVPIHGLASLETPKNTIILVLPETKTVYATIKFNNGPKGECPVLGVQEISGSHIFFLIHNGFEPATLHLVLAFSLPAGLRVANTAADLLGLDFDLRLASGLTWNYL